ncbi:MAG: hypothetical protein IKG15_08250 [Solobacterium sp.]|nr:hypothetical protein [Solobacterium sp.]
MKKAVIFLSSLLLLTGCTAGTPAVKTESDGILAQTKLSVENKKNGYTVFQLETEFLNTAEDQSLMQISYTILGKDASGNEVFTFHDAWNGQDTPLDPGQTTTASFGFQQKTGKSVKTLEVTIDSSLTAEEMPPVHLPQPGEYLYKVHKSDYIRNMKEELPVRINIIIDHMGMQETADITDPETIRQITDAFTKITIDQETEEFVTDNYNSIAFTFGDAAEEYISLNLKNLEYSVYGTEHMYVLGNFGEFWSLINDLADYPSYS